MFLLHQDGSGKSTGKQFRDTNSATLELRRDASDNKLSKYNK